jgi:hypothetical protein
MKRIGRVLGLVGVAAAVGFGAANAQGTRSWNVCGGNEFNTCASVDLRVTNLTASGASQHVVVRIWNLSGSNGTFAGTVFTQVGFEGIGNPVSYVSGTLAMSGPKRPGDTPAQWRARNDKEVGGGVKLDIVTGTTNGIHNGVSTACAPSGSLPGGDVELWQNPCRNPAGDLDPGWIVLSFNVSGGPWAVDNTYLLVKGQNGPNGNSTECITGGSKQNCSPTPPTSVVPEPVSMLLLASGLMGLGGVSVVRRRKRNGDIDSV